MEVIKDSADFSKRAGRTYAHVSAKPTAIRRMPHLEAGALATFFRPAACLRGFTKAKFHATQQRTSSTKATVLSMRSIVGPRNFRVNLRFQPDPTPENRIPCIFRTRF